MTELLLFYADDIKDTITGRRLIERVKIATWDDKRKGQELASILQAWAQSWWNSLAVFQTNQDDRATEWMIYAVKNRSLPVQ